MFAAVGRAVSRRPWWVIGCWLAAAVALIAVSPRISSVTTSDQSTFLPSGTESVRAMRLAAQAFPQAGGATGVIVVQRAGGTLTDADLAAIAGLAARLQAHRLAGVLGISFDPQGTVAPNRRVALLVAVFTGPATRPDVLDAVPVLRRETAAGLAGTGLSAGMTGEAAIAVDNKEAFAHAEKIVTGCTLALIVLLLLLIFRSPVAALLPLFTVGLVYGVATALVAAGARLFAVRFGAELPTLLTVVLFGIGTDYLLFLLFRYRERLRAGDSPGEAIGAAVERIGEAIASAALAVVAAFAALALASLRFFSTLGPALAVGVAVMLLAALTLVPAVVTVAGRWIFWPARAARSPRPSRFVYIGRLVARRPVPVIVGCVLLLGALATGLGTLRASYDPVAQLPAGTEAARAYDELRGGFPAGELNPTDVYLHGQQPISAAELTAFAGRLGSVSGVAGVRPPVLSADRRTGRVPLVLAAPPYSSTALDLVSGPLREQAGRAAPPGTTVLIGGPTMTNADIRRLTDHDFSLVFPVAAALFALILAGLLRAVAAPVYLVAMVVGGFAATLGAAAWAFGSGLAFSIPIVLYLFVTAIGTDYNILVTARLREELREGRPPREAAALAVRHAGPSVAAAAAILAGAFAALLIAGLPFFRQIGFAVAAGIAVVALVVSILLVPATTALLGRAAWWPSRPDRPRASHDIDVCVDADGSVNAWRGRATT
jgi:putative drug exporter of the RND superfamily